MSTNRSLASTRAHFPRGPAGLRKSTAFVSLFSLPIRPMTTLSSRGSGLNTSPASHMQEQLDWGDDHDSKWLSEGQQVTVVTHDELGLGPQSASKVSVIFNVAAPLFSKRRRVNEASNAHQPVEDWQRIHLRAFLSKD